MPPDFRSLFLRSLRHEASRDEIVERFGEPEAWGTGIDGSLLLAFRDKSIQMWLEEGRLVGVSLYYRSKKLVSSWPAEIGLPATLSGKMTADEVQEWLVAQNLPWRRFRIAGEGPPFFVVAGGVHLYFTEESRLDSLHVSCYLPVPGSPPEDLSAIDYPE